ncbi:MAG TPA: glycoside hydrolase family 38 C-terminal domain-containing protein, partial [Acidimicrobiales bacterium]|nr:glycoside hydrolase family 38 C-terminal domain-containing protein [Acidimicrobiales bacterium]
IAEDVIERACGAIAARLGGGGGAAGTVVVFNAGSHPRTDLVVLDPSLLPGAALEAGTSLTAEGPGGSLDVSAVQELADGQLGFLASVPGCGWARYALVPSGEPAAAGRHGSGASVGADGQGFRLSNGTLTAHIDPDGTISALVDHRSGRQLITPGTHGNVFQLHQDLPNDTDAWDVDQGTFARAVELRRAESIEVVESGPVRAAVRVVHAFGSSRLTQDIRLTAGSSRLEFATDVEWGERHRFLKVAFPLAVRAASASFEVQFGYVERPTHANTSWDAARFEVPAQRWADLSEPGCGAALLNDCKYGYDVRGSVMRLSLLRGPTWPDPEADLGSHRFSYALMAHDGLASSLRRAGSVTEEAEAFNLHLRPVPLDGLSGESGESTEPRWPSRASIVEVDKAMVSSLKRADNGDEIVARVYEPAGSHTRMSLRLGGALPVRIVAAARADALERELADVAVDAEGVLELDLRPFELVTLKLSTEPAAGARND